MLDVGHLQFEVIPSAKKLLLRIIGRPFGVETDVTTQELLALARYLEGEARKLTGEPEEKLDPAVVKQLVSAGLKTLAKQHHPDRGGDHNEMVRLNLTAAQILEKFS